MAKIGHFWPKSKAIHLVFLPKFGRNENAWFWLKIEKWQKQAIFGQKVRLYTWYFCQNLVEMKMLDFGCKLKSGKNRPFLAKK